MSKVPSAVLRAVAEISAAQKRLSDARRTLGRLTKPGHPPHLVDPAWAWAAELMEARRDRLLSQPGVMGLGLGFRLRGGAQTGRACLTVFVRQKHSPEELDAQGIPALPKSLRFSGHRLEVDVVELGPIVRQVDAGASLGPASGGDRGTLGALARDVQVGDTVALTAMHVTPVQEFPAGDVPAPQFVSPMPGGGLFATLRQGTMSGIDAAKLALDVQQPAITVLPSIGRLNGSRPLTFPGDQGTMVRMFGAVSGFQTGSIVNPIASIPAEDLDAATLVSISTQGGDSGAALVDPQGLLLGFLVGVGGTQLNSLRVFTPASLVLSRLGCEIPSS